MPRGVPAPNHTQTPNYLLDHLDEVKSEAELKVILAVVRKTFGWHKERDILSLTQLQGLTGLSRRSVIDGTEAAVAHGWIGRQPAGRSFSYALIIRDSEETSLSADGAESSPIEAADSAESAPKLVQKVHTQKKDKEIEIKEINTGAGAPAAEPDPVKLLAAAFEDASKITMPRPVKPSKSTQQKLGVLWWYPLTQMVAIANGTSEHILREVVKDMRARKLTIADPNSCLKNFISRVAELASVSGAVTVRRDADGVERVALSPEQQALEGIFGAEVKRD